MKVKCWNFFSIATISLLVLSKSGLAAREANFSGQLSIVFIGNSITCGSSLDNMKKESPLVIASNYIQNIINPI